MSELAAWFPQPGPQEHAITADWCEELFFGGAKYGGKSDYLLGDFLKDVPTYKENWHGILFRQAYPDLEEIIRRSHEIYPKTGAIWREQKKTWLWPKQGNASLKMRTLERRRDLGKYQGHSYTWIGFDELPQWSVADFYREAGITNLRWGRAPVPTKRIRATGNPGGPGHQWVKAYFKIGENRVGYVPFDDPETGMTRMFIPSKIGDNRLGLLRDPGYKKRLRGVGSKQLVRALLEGDWGVVTGAFFPEISQTHSLAPFKIPKHWTKFAALDWGYAKPFSIGWYAVCSGEDDDGAPVYALNGHREMFRVPRGAVIRYREWYGVRYVEGELKPDEGLKLTPPQVAKRMIYLEGDEEINYRVADPSIFKRERGPSIAEEFQGAGVIFTKGSRDRDGGWQQMRIRFGHEEQAPSFYVFANHQHWWRTVPYLQHDEKKPEDCDTDAEDHVGDETRYGLMSRPVTSSRPDVAENPHEFKPKKLVFNDLIPKRGSGKARKI